MKRKAEFWKVTGDVDIQGSTLPAPALRVLAKFTPERLRAIARRLDNLCLYGGADEVEAGEAALILHEAAEVCR